MLWISRSHMFRQLNSHYNRAVTDFRIRKAFNAQKWNDPNAFKVLIVSNNGNEGVRISKSQTFPFHYFSKGFRDRWGAEFRQFYISDIDIQILQFPEDADMIFFQPWFTEGVEKIVSSLKLLKQRNPKSKIVFLDPYAPLDLRFAEAVTPLVDTYVKKHVFLDRTRYGVETQGDTNLVEYYEQLYDLPASSARLFKVPQDFLSKILVGPSFFTAREMLTTFHSGAIPISKSKTYSVHARLGAKGAPWYQTMRERALLACKSFSGSGIVTSESVSNSKYMRELAQSRICFSPYGYGEVCWRDYEAIMCGALLVKPDMAHVQTDPDIFVPYETYVPVAWDFSDLAEKMNYYLANDVARTKIVNRAYSTLYEYLQRDAFIDQFAVLFKQF